MLQWISRGLSAARLAKSSPARSSAAGRTLLTKTSARAISALMAASPSGCLISSPMLLLFRLKLMNLPDMAGVRLPAARKRRISPPGASTFTTSAPWSARVRVQIGPTTTVVRSTTFTPSKGPAKSGELQRHLAAEHALGIRHPGIHLAIFHRAAVQGDGGADIDRPGQPCREMHQPLVGRVLHRRVQQQLHGQAPVLHDGRIAFLFARIIGVVVDAVRVP